MAYATTEHITNAAALAFIKALRAKFSGVTKTYGSRYMAQLEKVCKYTGGQQLATRRTVIYVLTINGVNKEFKDNREAGRFMEQKINDLFDLGILS